jgi:hypothetical protein
MQLRTSAQHRRGARLPANILTSALFVMIGAAVVGNSMPAASEEAPAEVAYVEGVTGRVLLSAPGRPTLLDVLDLLGEQARLDLQAGSELRLCHYRTQRLVVLKGPAQATVSRDGVTVGNAAAPAAGACAAPVVSIFQGGATFRSAALKTVNVPLRPSIKIVDRSAQPALRAALWDGEQRNVVMRFESDLARPILDDGHAYVLVVERGDRSEYRLRLQAGATTVTGPLMVVVR